MRGVGRVVTGISRDKGVVLKEPSGFLLINHCPGQHPWVYKSLTNSAGQSGREEGNLFDKATCNVSDSRLQRCDPAGTKPLPLGRSQPRERDTRSPGSDLRSRWKEGLRTGVLQMPCPVHLPGRSARRPEGRPQPWERRRRASPARPLPASRDPGSRKEVPVGGRAPRGARSSRASTACPGPPRGGLCLEPGLRVQARVPPPQARAPPRPDGRAGTLALAQPRLQLPMASRDGSSLSEPQLPRLWVLGGARMRPGGRRVRRARQGPPPSAAAC